MPIQSISLGVSGAMVMVFWLAIAAAIAVAVWAYRAPEPPLRPPLRLFLSGLRFLSLGAVVLALFQPVMTIASRNSERLVVPVLVDLSASMNLPAAIASGDTTTRLGVARAALDQLSAEVGSDVDLRLFGFGDRLDELGTGVSIDELELVADAGATRLGPALSEALRRRLSRLAPVGVVISDGGVNAGTDPLVAIEQLGVPLVTVSVSADSVLTDVWVSECLSNSSVFLGQETTVAVRIGSHLSRPAQTVVKLMDGDQVIVGETVRLPAGAGDVEIELVLKPTRLGAQRVRVVVDTLADEASTDNNERLLSLDVVEERLQVLILADEVSWDLAFMRRALDGDRTLETSVLARLSKQRDRYRKVGSGKIEALPAEASDFLPFGAVVLMGVRPDDMPEPTASALAAYVRDGGGVILCTGNDAQILPAFGQGAFKDLLPVSVTGAQPPALTKPELTAAGLAHPVSAMGESPTRAGALWAALPPVYRTSSMDAALGGDVLVEAQQGAQTTALVVAGPAGRGRALVIGAAEFWRWDFLIHEGESGSRLFERFAREAVRWTSEGRQRHNLELFVDKPVFLSGERVSLGARLTDDRLQPVDDARVVVECASDAGIAIDVELVPGETRGHYTGAAGFLKPGVYALSASATRSEDAWTAEGVNFVVDSANIEGTTAAANPAALRRLAQATEGAAVSGAEVGFVVRELVKSRQQRVASIEVRVWDHPALFLLFVGALTIEWLVRRRHGLA